MAACHVSESSFFLLKPDSEKKYECNFLPGSRVALSKIVTLASLESAFPTELLATHWYVRSIASENKTTRVEILPFWVTVAFMIDELFSNQLITGRGKPSAAQERVTVATPASR